MTRFIIAAACAATLAGCGGDAGDDAKGAADGATSAAFLAACTAYFEEAEGNGLQGRFDPIPMVRAYGVDRYCGCVDGNFGRSASGAVGTVSGLAGEDAEGMDAPTVSGAVAARFREGGVQYYLDALDYDRDPEGRNPPSTFRMGGATDACNEAARDGA